MHHAYRQLLEWSQRYKGKPQPDDPEYSCIGCGSCLSGGGDVGGRVCLHCAKCAVCRRQFPIEGAFWMGEAPKPIGLYVGLCSDCYSYNGRRYPFE